MKKMNKKAGKTSDKTIINLLIVANFFSLTVSILEKLHEKNVMKLDINIKIVNILILKNMKKKKWKIITEKCVRNWDCVMVVMTYVKNINLTIGIPNVFSNVRNVKRNCYSPVPNCRGVCNSRGSWWNSSKSNRT